MFEISGSTVIMCLSQLHASNCCHKLPALNGLQCRNRDNGPHLIYLGPLQMAHTTVNYKLH
jgi:hypothetical protein